MKEKRKKNIPRRRISNNLCKCSTLFKCGLYSDYFPNDTIWILVEE